MVEERGGETQDRANDALRAELRSALEELARLLLHSPDSTYRLLNAVRHLRVLTHLTILDEGRRAMVNEVLRELAREVVAGGPGDPRGLAGRVGAAAARL